MLESSDFSVLGEILELLGYSWLWKKIMENWSLDEKWQQWLDN